MTIGIETYRGRRNQGKFEFKFKPVTPDNRHACLGGPSAKFRAASPGRTRALKVVNKWDPKDIHHRRVWAQTNTKISTGHFSDFVYNMGVGRL